MYKSGHFAISYASFSVLVLQEVRENSWSLSTFSLLLEKPNFKNPCSFFYRFEHAKFVFLLIVNTVPCRTFRGISIKNVDQASTQCGNRWSSRTIFLSNNSDGSCCLKLVFIKSTRRCILGHFTKFKPTPLRTAQPTFVQVDMYLHLSHKFIFKS